MKMETESGIKTAIICLTPVSYTHLDVYKRQTLVNPKPYGISEYQVDTPFSQELMEELDVYKRQNVCLPMRPATR